jgi:hypothetical protein
MGTPLGTPSGHPKPILLLYMCSRMWWSVHQQPVSICMVQLECICYQESRKRFSSFCEFIFWRPSEVSVTMFLVKTHSSQESTGSEGGEDRGTMQTFPGACCGHALSTWLLCQHMKIKPREFIPASKLKESSCLHHRLDYKSRCKGDRCP